MMNLRTILNSMIVCGVCCAGNAFADDVIFGDWVVSIRPAAVEEKANYTVNPVKHEYVVREVREIRRVQPDFALNALSYRYGYAGSNYSIYFPYRNYRSFGFTSFYRPPTIYDYGYGR